MIKKILIGLAAVFTGFAIVVALQPDTFRVERSTTIPAAPSAVFPHLNDLRKAAVWSPWLKLDPTAKLASSASLKALVESPRT